MSRTKLLAIFAVAVTCVIFAQAAGAATVTGTVVSKTTDTIVISTPSGQETFHVMGSNLYPAGMDVGSRVTITYSPSATAGRNDVNTIVMASTSPSTPSPSSMTSTSANSVTGTVVSKTGDTVVISTPSGQRTFMVSAQNLFPSDMDVGDRVTVSFTPGTAGARDRADRITLASASTTTTDYSRDTSRNYSDARTSAYDRDDLPDTAGPVPVLTALGLAAVAGGLALRTISRRRANSARP